LGRVSVTDIHRVLGRYLTSEKRTIGWSVPSDAESAATIDGGASNQVQETQWNGGRGFSEARQDTAAAPILAHLASGTPVIIQRSALSPTTMLKVVVPTADFDLPDGVGVGNPAWALSSLDFELLPNEAEAAMGVARQIIETARPITEAPAVNGADPSALLEDTFRNVLGLQYPNTEPTGPVLLAVSGDVEPQTIFEQLEAAFGGLPRQEWQLPARAETFAPEDIEKQLSVPLAQERLGYIVRLPHEREPGSRTDQRAAWQIVLHILSHGYEGRLGKEAISRQGLVYYIASGFDTDGSNDWITLSMGVDPEKLPAMKSLLREQLDLLVTNPPSPQEIEAAREHVLGRYLSAAQSNPELAEALTNQWILYGSLESEDELRQKLEDVTRDDIMQVLPVFTSGSIVSIRNP
jgi:hypothetical protein